MAGQWFVRSFAFATIGADGTGPNGAPLPAGWEPIGAQWINGTWFIIGRHKWRYEAAVEMPQEITG